MADCVAAGTAGSEATTGDVLASLRALRTTLAKETEEANATSASRDKVRACPQTSTAAAAAKPVVLRRCVCTMTPQLAEEVEALEADNGKLEHQIAHLKKALAAEPAA